MARIILAAGPRSVSAAARLAGQYRVEYRVFKGPVAVFGDRRIIHTALSGGTLRDRLSEAVGRFGAEGIALWADRAREDFTLPAPTGSGTPLNREELARLRAAHGSAVFFSAELCAWYFTYLAGETGHLVLFDDGHSIRQKLRVAQELGIDTVLLPYETTADLLGEVLG